jgi:hypothetical protein
MRILLNSIFAAALLTVIGCQDTASKSGAPVATTEDEFAAYDAMIAEDQAQTAADEAESADE